MSHLTCCIDIDSIKNLTNNRSLWSVPSGGEAACLLFGADTQDDGFWYEIRAFGYGIPGTNWQVREGFVATLEDLAEILWGYEYRDIDGILYHVPFGMIGSQGLHTNEVYDWCIKHRGKVLPIKGEERKTTPMNFTKLDPYPGSEKPFPGGGIQLIKLDINYYKNKFYSKLKANPGDHGSDCSAYTLAAYDYYGVRNWPIPGTKIVHTRLTTYEADSNEFVEKSDVSE